MKPIRSIVALFAFLIAMLLSFSGQAEDKVVCDVAKWMSDSPAAVAVVDLQALKVKSEYMKVKQLVKNYFPRTLTGPNGLTDSLTEFENRLDIFEAQIDQFISLGAKKAYVFVDSQNVERSNSCLIVFPTNRSQYSAAKKFVAAFSKGKFIPKDLRSEWENAFYIKAYKDCIVLVPNIQGAYLDKEMKKLFFEELEIYIGNVAKTRNNKEAVSRFNRVSEGKTAEIQVYFFANGFLTQVLKDTDDAMVQVGMAPKTIINGVQEIAVELDIAKKDLRLQIFSKDAPSAKALSQSLPIIKQSVLNNLQGLDSPESVLILSDVTNLAFDLLKPEIHDNTLSWSSKTILKQLDDMLPKWTRDASAGLYAPVTDEVKEEANRIYSLAAPFINKQTIGVIHLDTADLDGAFEKTGKKVYKELKRLFPMTFSGKSSAIDDAINQVYYAMQDIDSVVSALHAVGGRDIFVIASLDDPTPQINVIVPFDKEKKADAKKLLKVFRQARFLTSEQVSVLEESSFRAIYKNCLVFGIRINPLRSKEDFIRSLKEFKPESVPEIRQGFELSWSYHRPDSSIALSRIQAIFNVQVLMNEFVQNYQQFCKALEQNDPEMAKIFPPFTGRQLADGVKAVVLESHLEKRFVNVHVISKDEKSAQDLASFIKGLKPIIQLIASSQIDPDQHPLDRDFYMDYMENFCDLFVLDVQGNVLSIRSNNVSEKYKPLFNWCVKNESRIVCGDFVASVFLFPMTEVLSESARRMQNSNNLRQLAISMHIYYAEKKSLPPAFTEKDGKRLHSWRVAILPYLDGEDLYNQIRLDEPWDSDWNKQFHDKCPKCFKNPNLDLAPSETTFAVVVGKNTAFPGSKGTTLETTSDGTRYTGMIVERSPVCWMDPNSDILFEEAIKGVNVSPNGIRSYFDGIFMLVMCDASAVTLPENVSSDFLRKLFERNDGCAINLDDPELNE